MKGVCILSIFALNKIVALLLIKADAVASDSFSQCHLPPDGRTSEGIILFY